MCTAAGKGGGGGIRIEQARFELQYQRAKMRLRADGEKVAGETVCGWKMGQRKKCDGDEPEIALAGGWGW